ncbi:MAG: GGDEF domain-containing protein [Desulfobacterales bacterium]|nr:GGDEF domain-containing protein [Desulfobacterales bacterium]
MTNPYNPIKESLLRHPSEPFTPCPAEFSSCPLTEEVARLRQRCRELEEMCQTDALTGFYNYRFLMDTLEREMERTRRTGLPTGLIMLDLDHFKRINDTYGHETGNDVLVHVAEQLKISIRRIDLPCRYGGEEFLVILPATRLQAALMTAERIRRDLHGAPAVVGDTRIQVTASFGVDAYGVEDALTGHELIQRVDRLVFNAKSDGRNRISHDMGRAQAVATEVTDAEKKGLLFRS